MKRPWQIWTLYIFSLAIVLPAMGWLTVKALELDRAEAAARRQTEEARRQEAVARAQAETARQEADLARQQAEMQELASSALWRMDWTLTPLVAQEAARPYYVYLPFYPVPGGKEKGSRQLAPSPLLVQPSEYVLLHFQLSADDTWTSPQTPMGPQSEAAIAEGTPKDNIDMSCERLGELKKSVSHEQLVTMLPEQMLPAVEVNPSLWVANTPGNEGRAGTENTITYDLGLKQLTQQLDEQQGARSQTPVGRGGRLGNPAGSSYGSAGGPGGAPAEPTPPNSNYTRGGGGPRTGDSYSGGGQRGGTGNSGNSTENTGQQSAIGFNNDYEANRRDQMLRGGNEWQRRNRAYESYAQSQIVQQRQGNAAPKPPQQLVSEGVSRPIWVGKNLILARRVKVQDRVLVQGCWLDWPKLKSMLAEEVADLLPNVELEPVLPHSTVIPGRALATLPVQLVLPDPVALSQTAAVIVPPAVSPSPSVSPIRLSLVVAWCCFSIGAIAVGILLQGVVTLSERRGAFVSAVTHELRTPLTTFRMYAEMLAEGMVPSEEQRQKYLGTLRVEADRLAHLVENVLSYARLERGKPGGRCEEISLADLLGRVKNRLADRTEQASMKLTFEADDAVLASAVTTDPAAVEQILFNLVDNACKYAVTAEDKRIHIALTNGGRWARIKVTDHGPGISAAAARKLFQPFSKSVHEAANSAPGVGLGLALSRRLARTLGGSLGIEHGDSGAQFVLTLPVKK